MTTDEKMRIISNWTNKFSVVNSADSWSTIVQYHKNSSIQSKGYDSCQAALDAAYERLSRHVWRMVCIQSKR